ncbi:MAG: sigma-70 family RNA polymerase sigma factor [Verrucomicrobiales bacterium]|nr:sigma-70 family RNA polymerase sigma factor [Verrucomicrobiales bacterium]
MGTGLSLDALRAGDGGEWEKAYPLLWEVAWRTVGKVCPHATPTEKEEMAAAALNGEKKVVSQITNPTQASFVQAQTFEDILNLTAAVVRNTTVDGIRKSVTRSDETNQARVADLFVEASNPTDQIEQTERESLLCGAISQLKDNYREVIEDFYYSELGTEEISRKRGRPKGTICVELTRARAELKKILNSGSQ